MFANTKTPVNDNDPTRTPALAWIVWGLAAAFFFLNYVTRIVPTVMHRYLQNDLGINEAGFGILIASFYISFTLMQIPVGLTVDRINTRTLLAVMSMIAGLGCVIFSMADSFSLGIIGRIIIGFSSAFSFVAAIRLATTWFPPIKLGLIVGLTQALGKLGATVGQGPMSFLVSAVGWRDTMLLIALFFFILAVLLYCFIQDAPGPFHHRHVQKYRVSIAESLRLVICNRQSWLNALYSGFLFAPTAVLGESIGPAWLQYGHGFTTHSAAFAIGLVFIGWGISGPISGWLSDKMGRRKPIMIISSVCGLLLMTVITYYPTLSNTTICILLLIYGITNTGAVIAYAVSTELFSINVVGTSVAFTSMISIFVGISMQPLVGTFIDLASGARSYHVEQLTLHDFNAGLWILPLCSLIALLLSLTIRETRCHRVE